MPPAMLSQAELLVRTAVRKPKFEKLDPAALKAVKQFARSSDAHVAAVFDQLWQHLGASHSQERWLSLEVAAELWDRSAAFRHALSRVIPDFVHLVIGDHAEHPLPPPTRWAEQLRTRAHELILQWYASHGQLPEYRALALARRHLMRLKEADAPPQASASERSASQREGAWRERWLLLRQEVHIEMGRGGGGLAV